MSARHPCYLPGHSNIADFYQERSVLITGATGFMGKVIRANESFD
jgi:FlaA1/EpsC-like NDP-sugar epimerase